MGEIVMFLFEMIAISTLLYLLYLVLFKGKASYIAQRVFLLLIPIIATISAFTSLNLIEIRGFGGKVIESITTSAPEAEFQNITTTETVSDKEFTIIRAKEDKHLVLDNIALIIWVTVSLILLSLFVRQILKIISLRRVATKEVHSDYSIYRLWSGSLIFSFLKDVYIAQNIEGEKFDFILQHELEHIRKRHYVDKMIAEIYSSIIWFNPIVKVIQRELSLIHEYEADHAVVESGCNIKAYKIFIFEEASTAIPAFVNGIK